MLFRSIPKHCFERSAATGLYYVARDVVSLATTFYLFNHFVTPEYISSTPLRASLWFLYTVVQGLFGTGLWVLAHECGHQSFSPSKVLNDTVGWFCHSALLVPYFSWKISHGKHHKATGNLERDMVFVPSTKQEWATKRGYLLHQLDELTEETPIATAIHLITQQIGGWPMYLFTNVTGHNKHEGQREGRGVGKQNGFGGGVNHFDPNSPLYEAKDAKLIALSDLGLLITTSILIWVGRTYGFSNLFVWYLAPYLWVNHWLGEYYPSVFQISRFADSCISGHHLPATHRSLSAPLHWRVLDIHSWCGCHNRSRIRFHWTTAPSRNCRDPRSASLCQHHPLLSCRRGQRRYQEGHGSSLPQ